MPILDPVKEWLNETGQKGGLALKVSWSIFGNTGMYHLIFQLIASRTRKETALGPAEPLEQDFLIWNQYTKSMTLCVLWSLYIEKARHFAKGKTICVMFKYTKPRTLCVTQFFMEFLKLADGGTFLYAKKCTLRYVLYTKSLTLCVPFLYEKKCTLCHVFISKCFCIVLIPITINVRTIKAIRPKNKFNVFINNCYYSYDKWMILIHTREWEHRGNLWIEQVLINW